jgi:DNA-binding Xre family transcriptional regulator
MNLEETIEEIRRRKSSPEYRDHSNKEGIWPKQDLAAYIGVHQSKMSRLGVRWDEYWPVFLRIMDLCEELGINPRKKSKTR